MKHLSQPSRPMYVVLGRGLDGDLYYVHMDPTTKRNDPGIWKIDEGDLKGETVHANADFYLHADSWHVMMPLLTPEWHKEHGMTPRSIFTREVHVTFKDASPKPQPQKNWKLKIIECSRSYRQRSITVVVNTSDHKKAFRIMLGATTFNAKGATALCNASYSWRHTAVNHTAQTCKLVFFLSDDEDITLHLKRLLEIYQG